MICGTDAILQKFPKTLRYGFSNLRYVSSLISGVGIFCLGSGVAWYHGIMGMIDPEPIQSLMWAYTILAGSLLSEGATLLVAHNTLKKSALARGQSLKRYILEARDPSVNVVLLEDAAAVLGVIIAASCMGLTSYTGNPLYDCIGSLCIGSLLAVVASFLIYSNSEALIGRAISDDSLKKISESLENDRMVSFKAEVDFDGREITRSYLDNQDLEQILKEVQSFKSMEEMEFFMLSHGERIVNGLGEEVDRIEKELKKRNPEVRHVDLEVL
ncbi:proton-coupled zinc antiporter SLC30A9, mitochondrial-like [Saccoglossus kowalevskii]